MAAGWLEEGPPEARELGEEIFALLDGFSEEEIGEVAVALESGVWETGSW